MFNFENFKRILDLTQSKRVSKQQVLSLLFFVFLGLILFFLWSNFGQSFQTCNQFFIYKACYYLGIPPVAFNWASFLIFSSVICLIGWQAYDLIKFTIKSRSYCFELSDCRTNLKFQGAIKLDELGAEKTLHLIQSEIGLIFKDYVWRDYKFNFQFKIPKCPDFSDCDKNGQLDRGFGIIIRAKDLGQYYMLKIDQNGYRPHIRNFFWENSGPICKITLLDVDLDKWISVVIIMKNNVAKIKIGNDKFDYILPTHSIVSNKEGAISQTDNAFVDIPFIDRGTVGFRSAPKEEVFIRDIHVSPLEQNFFVRLFGVK